MPSLWEFASARGMDRRRFLRLLVAGGATAVLAACADLGSPDAPAGTQPSVAVTDPAQGGPWFKDPAPFIMHGDKGLEARLENMQGMLTPNRLFFVRNNSVSLDLDADHWRLIVEGDAVSEPLELTYQEIRSLPSRTLTSYLECAGNHRAMFNLLNGLEASGTQWMTGAVGNGEWVGAQLRDVLTLAGIQPNAVSVLLVGLDVESPEDGFRYVLPVEKAMDPDTLVAYALNGGNAAQGPRLPGPRPCTGMGGQRQRQVAGPHRRFVGTDVDPEQHHVLHAHRRCVPTTGRIAGPAGHRAGDQERPGPALAGGTAGGTPPHPRVRTLPGGHDFTRRLERRLGPDLERGRAIRSPVGSLLGSLRVSSGTPSRANTPS